MKKTRLHDIHVNAGAKMVEFAGYNMPVLYSSIIEEHKAVRNSVGLFDVSHMGEVFVRGPQALDFVQYLTVNNTRRLEDGQVQYSAMCYEDGGIVDDLLVYRINASEFMLVINASNREKDFEWMQANNNFNCELSDESDEYTLIAVQGPKSKEVVKAITSDPLNMEFYSWIKSEFDGNDMIISRTGYTGELGFEIYFKGSEEYAAKVWNTLMEAGKEYGIKPAGLGARDSLRLEMGYCLYGNDIDKTTNPLEAGLGWITKLKSDDFIGKDVLLKVKEEGKKRRLVPMVSDEKCFPRQGYEIFAQGRKIGYLTSGTVSPTLEKPIALGYVEIEFADEGTEVNFNIRNKEIPARVTKLPFVKN